MHMADALVAPTVATTMYACSAIAGGFSIKKVRLENDTKKIPVMGVMGAFVFAAQMINFTIPGTGSSGHIGGAMLLSALLGPYAGFLTMIGVLSIQALLFADGGLLALGCNVWNMAFYGCFIGSFFIWKPLLKHYVSKKRIVLASILGCVLTLQLGAFSVTVETLASGITELPFRTFVAAMQPIHLVIGLVEGCITAAVLTFIYDSRPELLWGISEGIISKEGKLSFVKLLSILGVFVVAIGGIVSLFASANPDGLEWAMQKTAHTTELSSPGGVHTVAKSLQKLTALLPDYSLPGSESPIGTSFSGVIGAGIVFATCMISCYLFKLFRKKVRKSNEQN